MGVITHENSRKHERLSSYLDCKVHGVEKWNSVDSLIQAFSEWVFGEIFIERSDYP